MGNHQQGKYKQRNRIAQLISWGHWFTFANIILCLMLGLLYIETVVPATTTLAGSYLTVSWLGHFAFLPFVFFIVLIFPLCILLPYSRILRGYAATVASIGVFALLLDALFFRQYGFHLNTYSLTQITADAEEWFAGGSFVLLLLVILGFVIVLGIQLLLANLIWKRHAHLQGKAIGKYSAAVFICAFFISHSTHIWADATLYTPITQQDDLFPLSYPTTAKSLMARHGWITVDRLHTSPDRFAGAQYTAGRYPTAPLLCSKEDTYAGVTIFAFDQLSAEGVAQLQASVSNLELVTQPHVGHRNVHDGLASLLYSTPDLYIDALNANATLPAYWRVLSDFSISARINLAAEFNPNAVPQALRAYSNEWQPLRPHSSNLQINLVTEQNIADVIQYLQSQRFSGQEILITGLAAPNNAISASNPSAVHVPLLTLNISLATRSLSALEDIIPTALANYINCAENSRPFSNGANLRSNERDLPRVLSVRPFVYIFEVNQTTVIDSNGELQLFNQAGELQPGAVPPTPVFINSLRELQRFGG